MRTDELRALGDLAGDAAAGIATQAREVHESVAARVFGALGPTAAPVRAVHDRVASGAYAAASALTGALVKGAAAAASLARPDDAASLRDAPRGRLAVGALNGMWGDRLYRAHSTLETPMAVRVRGHDVAIEADALRRAFPHATPRLAVFLHGLCETEDAWRLGAARHVPYGDRLEAELGYTPVFLRYNSGRHISHNGRALAALLDAVCAHWPEEVSEVALIGHSMGGLVARGACHYAPPGSWRERVRHVFSLGSPHKGAPLELGANAVCHAGCEASASRTWPTATSSTPTGRATTPTPSGPTRVPRSRSLTPPRTTSSAPASPVSPTRPWGDCWATCSSYVPAPGHRGTAVSACASR